MKRSPMVILLAGGTALAGMVAYTEFGRTNDCPPDATGNRPASCSSGSSSSSHGGSSGGYGSSSSSHSSNQTAHGGFGATGAAHGGFGS